MESVIHHNSPVRAEMLLNKINKIDLVISAVKFGSIFDRVPEVGSYYQMRASDTDNTVIYFLVMVTAISVTEVRLERVVPSPVSSKPLLVAQPYIPYLVFDSVIDKKPVWPLALGAVFFWIAVLGVFGSLQ
jgi:hypothetical protein